MKQVFLLLFIIATLACNRQPEKINLAGEWQFQTDPDDRGVKEEWYNTDLPEIIHLPGSMAENGKGNDITLETQWTGGIRNREWYNAPNYAPYFDADNIRFPYWLQPVKKYTGAAWYRKTVEIPESWLQETVWLTLERPHWESSVWVNGQQAGVQNSLAIPHVYNISEWLQPGKNEITVRIDNRVKEIDPGNNSHSITDHTQSNWNGIVGEISLSARSKIYFENINVFPDITTRTARIKATVFNSTHEEKTIKVTAGAQLKNVSESGNTKQIKYEFEITPGENLLSFDYPMGENTLLWDEFNPNVYQLSLNLEYKNGSDQQSVDFGFREFKAGWHPV